MPVIYLLTIQLPLGSYLVTNLLVTSCIFEINYLIPITFFICVLMVVSAFSFLKERIVLPIIMLVYSLFDFFLLAYSFLDAWFSDGHFIVLQAIQLTANIIVINFMVIYFVLLRQGNKTYNTGDG